MDLVEVLGYIKYKGELEGIRVLVIDGMILDIDN